MDHLDLIRKQFGANAANYATSPVHAKGASLARLVEVLELQPEWSALDIATAAGHTAFAVAPHVQRVTASDVTPEMLDVASKAADERAITNVAFETADAEALPFEDDTFDAVTCRIAPHHFPHPERFVAEVSRVLRSGGVFGLVDNVVPDDQVAANFANRWEKRRDPSHVRCLSVHEWLDLLVTNGLEIRHSELIAKRMVFSTWADNMDVTPGLRTELLTELESAPDAAKRFLRPDLGSTGNHDDVVFHLTECIVVAVRS